MLLYFFYCSDSKSLKLENSKFRHSVAWKTKLLSFLSTEPIYYNISFLTKGVGTAIKMKLRYGLMHVYFYLKITLNYVWYINLVSFQLHFLTLSLIYDAIYCNNYL